MEYNKFVTLLRFLQINEWKQRGNNVVISCINPNHRDGTPSFSIDYVKGMFHCFGCGLSGTITKLVRIKLGLKDDDEAYGVLKKLNIYTAANTSISNEDILKKYSNKLIEEETNIYFPTDILPITKGDYHYLYINDRGLDNVDNIISNFKVYKHLFRLFVPIFDVKGKLVGYGERTITDQKFLDKYPIISKPEQPKILYPSGFNLTNHIFNLNTIETNVIVLVEGMFDVFNVWDKGYKNIGATFSNKMSQIQANLLKDRGFSQLVLLVDRDSQGMILVNCVYNLLRSCMDKISIALIPVGKDPGECTKEELDTALVNTIPLQKFTQMKWVK